jgi:acyl-CoA synthetase (AMP-forming)/AMP-acid ligase II
VRHSTRASTAFHVALKPRTLLLIMSLLFSAVIGGILLQSAAPSAQAQSASWLRAVHRHGGTISGGPTFSYELCLRRIPDHELEGLDLSSWRFAFNGAEPVSPETMSAFEERFAKWKLRRNCIAPVYGLAEASVGLAFTPTVGGHERQEEEGVQEAASQFFYLPAFALLGALLPCFWIYAEVGRDIHARARPDNPYRAFRYDGERFVPLGDE